MRRLLEDGVFENEVPGRFSLGYGVAPGEIEAIFNAHGFLALELLAAESLSAGVSSEIGEVIEAGGPASDAVMRLMIDFAGDPRALASARHLLFVGRRSSGTPAS